MLYKQAYAGSCYWKFLSCEFYFVIVIVIVILIVIIIDIVIENSYPWHHCLTFWAKVEYLVDEAYIDKEDQGDLAAMTPTIVDMLGVFFLKVQIIMITFKIMTDMIKLRNMNDMIKASFLAGFFLWVHGREFSAGQHCLLVLITKYEHEFDNKIPTTRIATNITHISISGIFLAFQLIVAGIQWNTQLRISQSSTPCSWALPRRRGSSTQE